MAGDLMQARDQAKGEPQGSAAGPGWMDRLAQHGLGAAAPEGALRPRLPYPFEALRFAHDDIAPPRPARAAMAAPVPAAMPPAATPAPALRTTHAARVDAITQALPGEPALPSAPVPDRPTARPPDPPPVAARRLEPPLPAQAQLRPPKAAADSAAVPAPLRTPANNMAPMQPAAATMRPIAAALPASPRESVARAQEALAHAAPRSISAPLPATRHRDDPAPPAAQPAQPAAVRLPQVSPSPVASNLRSASLQQPLPATQPQQAAPEITIDIHIGRIDVRAPAAAPAPPAAAAPAPRTADALHCYLQRRGRGARS
jgi:hypothetical protein